MNRQIRANDDRWLDGPSPANVPIGFAYDRPFNTLKITDPMGRAVESYQLDAQDRPVSVTNIQGQVMTVNWGVGDYVKGIIRFDGSVVTNYYGADGRLLFVMNGAKGSHVIWTADGQLSYACGYTNTYDSLDRLLSEKQYASTGLTYTASWNYDLAGNRTAAVTNGVTNLYSYAAGNILTNFGSGTLV